MKSIKKISFFLFFCFVLGYISLFHSLEFSTVHTIRIFCDITFRLVIVGEESRSNGKLETLRLIKSNFFYWIQFELQFVFYIKFHNWTKSFFNNLWMWSKEKHVLSITIHSTTSSNINFTLTKKTATLSIWIHSTNISIL